MAASPMSRALYCIASFLLLACKMDILFIYIVNTNLYNIIASTIDLD
jgi:hypothetical protein